MKRLTLAFVFVMAGLGLSRVAAQAPKAAAVPVLVELFTSEGCNSCPPADRLLEILLEQQPIEGVFVIPMSEHVTYWDQQGWKDPFGAEQFTTRQQQYGKRFNIESIFTPQMVIDGTHQVVATDKRAIEGALKSAAAKPKPAITVAIAPAEGVLNVTASGAGLKVEKDADLLFALTEDQLSVDVTKGENADKTLRHSAVVRILQRGKIKSASETVTLKIDPEWKMQNLRVVAFTQSTKNMRILSVGYSEAQ